MLKRIVMSLILPVSVFLIMLIMSRLNGKMFFGTWPMWRSIMVNIGVSITCALGIGIQLKNGRFDFSGGAIMLLAAIIAGNYAKSQDSNPIIFFALAMVLCLVLSMIVALVYVYGRLPIIIATIGMVLLYESLTTIIYRGGGVNIVANTQLRVFSTFPYVLIPLIGAILLYAIYSHLTVAGKQGMLLANQQQVSVNIGIKEKKNVLMTYVFSGLIFGFATVIYTATGLRGASYASLTTVGQLFANILPVFIGLMLAKYCGDTIGIIIGAVTLTLMAYGLEINFTAEMGGAIATIITGVFILMINVLSAKGHVIIGIIKKYVVNHIQTQKG